MEAEWRKFIESIIKESTLDQNEIEHTVGRLEAYNHDGLFYMEWKSGMSKQAIARQLRQDIRAIRGE